MRRFLAAAAILGALSAPAYAVTVNVGDVGLSGTTQIQGYADVGGVAVPISGLTGTLYLQYDGATLNANGTQTWNFDYTVTNTSSGNTTMSSITSFGLNTTPNVAGANSTGLYDLALLNPQFPNVAGANVIEMCFSAGQNSCNANGNTLTPGQSTSGEFNLIFGSALTSISLDDAYFRFQNIDSTVPYLNGGSGVGFDVGGVCPGCTPTPQAVPGPIVGAGLPGLIVGCLTLMGLARRRRKAAVA
jgi:hypothetical protein